MKTILKWLAYSLVLLFSANIVPGIHIGGFFAAMGAIFVIGIVNVFIRPLVMLLTLPINLLTLGLFTFIINALLLLLSAHLVHGFRIDGFLPALGCSLILSFFSLFIDRI